MRLPGSGTQQTGPTCRPDSPNPGQSLTQHFSTGPGPPALRPIISSESTYSEVKNQILKQRLFLSEIFHDKVVPSTE